MPAGVMPAGGELDRSASPSLGLGCSLSRLVGAQLMSKLEGRASSSSSASVPTIRGYFMEPELAQAWSWECLRSKMLLWSLFIFSVMF